LARRFSPFNFSVVPGFPNVVPTVDELVDFLPIFKEHKDDSPAKHLSEFHGLMHEWEIHHEDVLLKMFMFSLAGDARERYHSLPPASISSLEQFHAAFNKHCQRYYSYELIFHSCCEEYKGCIPDMVVSNGSCEDEGYTSKELTDLVKSLSAMIEELKADHACCSYEENAVDILVFKIDVLGSPSYDEEVSMRDDQEQTTYEGYPNKDEEEPSFLMVPLETCSMAHVYDDYDSDPLESHEEEMEETNE
jgi:hypothetical protein